MSRYYVERDSSGALVGYFTSSQGGRLVEKLDEDSPEMVAFLKELDDQMPENRKKRDWVWWAKRSAAGLAALIFSASGLSGLVVAGQTMADVETLKEQAKESKAVAAKVITIEAEVKAIRDEQEQARERDEKLEGKLDTINQLLLDRLPRPE